MEISRKRPPSTPLTPSLVKQNVLKKNKFTEGDLTKKNLREILVKNSLDRTNTPDGKDKDNAILIEDESLIRSASDTESVSRLRSGLKQAMREAKKNMVVSNGLESEDDVDNVSVEDLYEPNFGNDQSKLKFDDFEGDFLSFDSNVSGLEFEIHKVGYEIENVINDKARQDSSDLLEFLKLERCIDLEK